MRHDFLCRIAPGKPTTFGDCVYCSLIRTVRAAALREAVDAVRGIDSCPECSVDEAVAAIEALGGER